MGKDIELAILFADVVGSTRLYDLMGDLRARDMVAEKYQDRFVDEYWSAWTRRLERLDAAPAGRNV